MLCSFGSIDSQTYSVNIWTRMSRLSHGQSLPCPHGPDRAFSLRPDRARSFRLESAATLTKSGIAGIMDKKLHNSPNNVSPNQTSDHTNR